MKNAKQSLLLYELELYSNLYEAENKYRNDISDRVFKTITVIIPLISALIWLIIKFTSIYEYQCYCLKYLNLLILFIDLIISIAITYLFFKVLYDYRDTKIDPEELYKAVEEYKANNIDENVILLTNKTLINSYKNAAIKNSKENEKRIDTFSFIYKLIFIDIIILTITFLIEIFS